MMRRRVMGELGERGCDRTYRSNKTYRSYLGKLADGGSRWRWLLGRGARGWGFRGRSCGFGLSRRFGGVAVGGVGWWRSRRDGRRVFLGFEEGGEFAETEERRLALKRLLREFGQRLRLALRAARMLLLRRP